MPPVKDKEYTGGSVSYYSVRINSPTIPRDKYTAECNDIIEALNMNYAEGNAFKALWRMAAARQGKMKQGYKDGLYDAEKVVFFGERLIQQYKEKENAISTNQSNYNPSWDKPMDSIQTKQVGESGLAREPLNKSLPAGLGTLQSQLRNQLPVQCNADDYAKRLNGLEELQKALKEYHGRT